MNIENDEEILLEKVKSSIRKISPEERVTRSLACDELKSEIDYSALQKN